MRVGVVVLALICITSGCASGEQSGCCSRLGTDHPTNCGGTNQ